MMCFKQVLFTILLASVLFSCKNELPKTDVALIREMVINWDKGINAHDVDVFGGYYSTNLTYYGQRLNKNEVLASKLNFINMNADFKQFIDSEIEITPTDKGAYKATFNKKVKYSEKSLDVIAFLEWKKMDDGKWYIVSESDNVTEDKIKASEEAKEKAKQALLVDYEFEQKVTLTGTLGTITYKDGLGNNLQVYILTLENSINVNAPNNNYDDLKDVKEIQVGFANDNNKKQYINKLITISGEIYGEETVNDRRPIVMIMAEITK